MGLYPAFYVRVLEQLAEVDARVLLTLGEAGDPAELGPLPRNIHAERWWPQSDVLPHAAVVVGHGGFGTTQAALGAGVPQVVLPLFSFDQFANAQQVAAVGVGVALVGEATAGSRAGDLLPRGPQATDRLMGAVGEVLARPQYTLTAEALAAEIDALPPVDVCVSSLAQLTNQSSA
jgi:UDP:flavonoid glycosyltransferase YjiC (YdhE family)